MSIQKINSENSYLNYSSYLDKKANPYNLYIKQILQLFIEQAPIAVGILNRQMRYIFANNQWLEIHNSLILLIFLTTNCFQNILIN